MRRLARWAVHPVTMIALVQLAWTLSLIFWIRYFVGRYRQMVDLAGRTGLRPQDLVSWAPLIVGIVLLGVIFGGTLALTLYIARQALANEQMRNFLSFVSHELRTPLTSIRLLLETMRDHEIPVERQQEFVSNMLQDTDRLSLHIGSILDAFRIDRRGMPIHKEYLSLDRFVRDYARERGPSIESGGHELVLERMEALAAVGDRAALRTALDNLVRNAERYSEAGTRIALALYRERDHGVIEVRDEGIGIERAELKKIFGLFYRGLSGHRVTRHGSGLGLYIVRGIVTLHGGRVSAHSDGPGRGSRFAIRIPLASAGGGAAP